MTPGGSSGPPPMSDVDRGFWTEQPRQEGALEFVQVSGFALGPGGGGGGVGGCFGTPPRTTLSRQGSSELDSGVTLHTDPNSSPRAGPSRPGLAFPTPRQPQPPGRPRRGFLGKLQPGSAQLLASQSVGESKSPLISERSSRKSMG